MGTLLLTSCDDNNELSVSPTKVNITLEGGNSENITIEADGEWTATPADSWAKVVNPSGNGNAQIIISAEATTEERRTTVTVNCGDEEVDITVNQSSAENFL